MLEDDVTLPAGISSAVSNIIAKLPSGWDFVHLESRRGLQNRAVRPLAWSGDRTIVRFSRLPPGTAAYLISRRGAEKLLKPCLRAWPFDVDTRRPWVWGLDAYGVAPGLIPLRGEPSTIYALGGRSGGRRGLSLHNPMRSITSMIYNIQKLGPAWWLWCAMQNSGVRFARMLFVRKSARHRLKPRPTQTGSTNSPQPSSMA